jgi:hypothetical protein
MDKDGLQENYKAKTFFAAAPFLNSNKPVDLSIFLLCLAD